MRSGTALGLGIILFSAGGWAQDQVPPDPNDEAFAAMVALVVAHDVAIIGGILPTPAIQLVAEGVELGANLGLKAIAPWLEPPPDRVIDPADSPDLSYAVVDAGCGIEFELLSHEAEYENMFGIANFRDPYTDRRTGRVYPWNRPSAPLETRWGFLRAPELYHANTSVKLRLRTPFAVSRYDGGGGLLEPREPIDWSLDEPQTVFLPIGRHPFEWAAATEINWVTDAVIPGALLAIGVLTELKNAYGGMKVAKQVKGVGIGDAVIREPLDPDGAKRLSDGVKRFEDVWQKAFTDGQARRRSKMLRELRKEIACVFGGTVFDVIDKVGGYGVDILSEETAGGLYRAGVLTSTQADLVATVYSTLRGLNRSLAIAAIKAALDCDDPDETVGAIIEALIDAGLFNAQLTKETKERVLYQFVTVLDSVPPTIAFDAAPMTIEAADFGGTRLGRAYPQLLALAEAAASDNCGRRPELSVAGPELLPLGLTDLTWTARDRGPNPVGDGKNYAPTAVQRILVRDTQPPILLAPPSKVIEAAADVPLAAAGIGDAATVDLVDVQPHVEHDAPATFPLDRRTRVEWTATDSSGNSAAATQLVTVKTVGTNTAPVAHPAFANTLTAEPVDIRLTGADADVLDGVADPLWFRIESRPKRGEFVAPLFPFFIEDYRTRPNDGLGEDFDPINDEIYSYVGTTFCATDLQQRIPPRNFVHEAQFVHVTDEGIRYVLDEFFECDQFSDRVTTSGRFSKWSPAGEFLGQMRLGENREDRPHDGTFVVDRDGLLYFNTTTEPSSSSNQLRLHKCTTDWPTDRDVHESTACSVGYTFSSSSAPNEIDSPTLALARIDSGRNVAYVGDAHGLFAFELLADTGVRYLGELGPRDEGDAVIEGWLGKASALEVGSDGSLYVADELNHRIHRLERIRADEQDGLVPGNYVGWSGRCAGSGNKACDDVLQRSRGYSCTFASESCTVVPAARAGSAQGQFDTPRFIAIDPNDVLYVADYGNARIQRLAPDGTFAGEAVSEGSGINKGDRPSFVIGNMGKPASVSVNSSQFFVVDRDEQFVHVFGTLPFKDIGPDAVTVTYVSKQDFPNPNISGVDSFTFTVTDGLATSAPASATITVDRNFRPPVAIEAALVTAEDTELVIALEADDPDGIAGKDFLGLDTLSYAITALPRHGELTGSGAEWTYRPNPGFYGTDEITFRVNDGRDDSNEANISIEVQAINDPPEVTIEVPRNAGRGFPLMLMARFVDDPAESYQATVTWGDDRSSVTGGISGGMTDPALDGVLITAPPAPGVEGQLFAQHVYDVSGVRTVTVCLTDDGGLTGCDSLQIDVQPLVSVGYGGIVYDEPLAESEVTDQEVLDGVPFTYEVTILNAVPSSGAGLAARAVVVEASLPANTLVSGVSISQGSCTAEGLVLACTVGDLAPDAKAVLKVQAAGPGTLRANEARDLEGKITTASDAVESEIEFIVNVDVLPNLADDDGDGMPEGYERAHGLDFTRNDGGEDADGDGLDNRTEYEIGTSPRLVDTDGDGLTDYAEYRDGTSDPTLADTDGDGMPDGWEIMHGFSPRLADDALADADGDGLDNLGEYTQGKDPRHDDVAPSITVPPDITVVATGRLTRVPLGTATAVDARDGPRAVEADRGNLFEPGANVVRWSAADSLGNSALGVQHVNVIPLATVAVDQNATEGSTAIVRVELNGDAVSYPVTIPYSVGGTATNPADHSAASDVLSIASGRSGVITVPTALDGVADPDETVVVTLGSPTNAALGPKSAHTITIREHNLPPRVRVATEQGGVPVTTVTRDGGPVSLLAEMSDDPADTHGYDWSGSDVALVDAADVAAPSLVREPATLPSSSYAVHVAITDNGLPAERGEARTVLRFIDRSPVLSSADDSDGDGLDDRTEGIADADGDRVPDYLDPAAASNVLPLAADGRAAETNVGLALRLGERAFVLGEPHGTVLEDALGADVDYGYPGGVFDFEITDLEPGGMADVVLPLARPIVPGAIYRKLLFGAWQDFSVLGGDRVASAPGAEGVCPPAGSAAYRPGLEIGHGCVQLTMTDGGPNDADGLADGVIRDPGGVAVPVSVELEALPQASTYSGNPVVVMFRLRLHSESGDALLRSVTLEASGRGNDRTIDEVLLVHDVDGDGAPSASDPVLARGAYRSNDGSVTLQLSSDLEVPVGTTEILVAYGVGSWID